MIRRLALAAALTFAGSAAVAIPQAEAATIASGTAPVGTTQTMFVSRGGCQVRIWFYPNPGSWYGGYATAEIRSGGNACYKIRLEVAGLGDCYQYCVQTVVAKTSGIYPPQYRKYQATLPAYYDGIYAHIIIWNTSGGPGDASWVLWWNGNVT